MNTKSIYSYNNAKEQGFTMVELMVAVLVLAIGLLGLAGLQVWGLSNNHNAYLRTQATLLAQDIIERIRSNTGVDYSGADASEDNCVSNACSSAQMAGYDIAKWLEATALQLPGGNGTIDKTGEVYNITISWTEQESDPNNPKVKHSIIKSFSTSFQP